MVGAADTVANMTELPGPLVSAGWLAEHLDDVIVADVRWNIAVGPQPDDHAAGHIPGAVFVDLDADLSAPAGDGGRHPLPSSEDFAAARSRLGFDGRPVVAYDAANGAIAARLWWMLDSIGQPVAVLDGGLAAWAGELEVGVVVPTRVPVAAVPWPDDRFVEVDIDAHLRG